MAFPTSPTDGQLYTNTLGTTFQYVSATNKWIVVTGGQNLAPHSTVQCFMIDGSNEGIGYYDLATNSTDYVLFEFLIPKGFPVATTSRIYLIAEWYNGNQATGVSMLFDSRIANEGVSLNALTSTDQAITVPAANQYLRITDFYLPITANTFTQQQSGYIKLKQNNQTAKTLRVFGAYIVSTSMACTIPASLYDDSDPTLSANLDANGKKITALAAATTNGDAVRYEQYDAVKTTADAALPENAEGSAKFRYIPMDTANVSAWDMQINIAKSGSGAATIELDFVNGGNANKTADVTVITSPSAILPANTKAIVFTAYIYNTTNGNYVVFERLGESNQYRVFVHQIHASVAYVQGLISLDATTKHMKITYSFAGNGEGVIAMAIMGYYI